MALTPEQKRHMTNLLKLEGAVQVGSDARDPFAFGIDTPSPSFNFCFDNTWLLPDGYTMLMGGPPKGGKSILINAIEGRMHQADENAVSFKINTEMRESVQVTPAQKKLWGIDDGRRIVYEVREPANIFDRIEQEIPKLVQAGIKVRLVIIDSLNDIIGRRTLNADSVDQQQIADRAATIQDGLSRIKGVLRRNGVSLILTTQVRTEMDQLEQKRGNKLRLAVSWAVKHQAEYFFLVERFMNKEGKTDMQGNKYEDTSVQGLDDEADERAHQIRVTCQDNSLGRPGRVGIFTLDHDLGVINSHEEVYRLGKGFGVLTSAKQGYYTYGERTWHGEGATLEAIKGEPELYASILRDCKSKDLIRTRGTVG